MVLFCGEGLWIWLKASENNGKQAEKPQTIGDREEGGRRQARNVMETVS
jgi:hypothetical protein